MYVDRGNSRQTRQRAAILEAVRGLASHPTADEVWRIVRERMPRISLGTVYRNLDMLVETGDVVCLQHAGGSMRFDANVVPHHHVRCIHCGIVADVNLGASPPDVDGLWVPGFARVLGSRIELDGVCDTCSLRMLGDVDGYLETPGSPLQCGDGRIPEPIEA
jgi:Fur family ferric uptake transcriptional regulator